MALRGKGIHAASASALVALVHQTFPRFAVRAGAPPCHFREQASGLQALPGRLQQTRTARPPQLPEAQQPPAVCSPKTATPTGAGQIQIYVYPLEGRAQ